MSFSNAALREQVLFELWKMPSVSEADLALKEALGSINSKILASKGEWTRKKQVELFGSITKKIAPAYEKFSEALHRDTREATKAVFNEADTSLVDKLVAPGRLIQGYTFEDLMKTNADNHIRQMKRVIASGAVRGTPVSQIAAELSRLNDTLTNRQIKTVAFTYITEARAEARHESYKQLEKLGAITGYEYVATLDSRTSEYCRRHDGLVYNMSIAEASKFINVHFNCRSVLAPYNKENKKRASRFGPTINESFGPWFDRQDEAFQKITLGAAKYAAFKKGSYRVGALADLRGELLNLEQIAYNLTAASIVTDHSLDDVFTQAHIVNSAEFQSRVESIKVKDAVLTISGKGIEIERYRVSQDEVVMNVFKLSDDLQGRGFAKQLYRQVLPEYERLGIKTLTLTTEGDGNLVWGKFGYTPQNPVQVSKAILSFIDVDEGTYFEIKEELDAMKAGDTLAFSRFLNDFGDIESVKKALSQLKISMILDLKDAKVHTHLVNYLTKRDM